VAAAGWHLARTGELWTNVEISTWRAVVGFAIGGGIGFALGMMNGLWSFGETLTDGTLQMIRNVPHLALIPLVILWFGIGEEAKIFLVALGVFFPMYVNTQHGVRSVDPHLLEMGRAYGMSDIALFLRVVLPGALPSIFVGLRYGLGIMWLTLIVAETIAATSGIGFMAMTAREFMQVDVVVFSILTYAALGRLADGIARFLERTTLAWNPTYAKV
jgi:sulfonate transport system permease protein